MTAAADQHAWLLDLYTDPRDGLVLWFLCADGQRRRLRRPFPITFYAAGPTAELRRLAAYVAEHAPHPRGRAYLTRRRDLFHPEPLPVLAVTIASAHAQPAFFHAVAKRFPGLTYFDADLPLALRYVALTGVFPLGYCRVTYEETGALLDLQSLDSPWDLDPLAEPPLRVLALEPDVSPAHAPPQALDLWFEQIHYHLPFHPVRPFLLNLQAILRRHDPDLLLTNWGDTWLLPELDRLSREHAIALPLCRDPRKAMAHRAERSYFTYGQIIHRGRQSLLFGRWHIDQANAMLWGDYGLEGVLELARITRLPVQTAARTSPGTGISAMQIFTALRQEVLVPWHKQQAETPRSARDLFYADQGGLVYQPVPGLHTDVAEVDFISMYPSIMVHFNLSPETVGSPGPETDPIPELNLAVDRTQLGLIPRTLAPLLERRIALKRRAARLPAWDPRRRRDKLRAQAEKWLLVTCFGYLGYKNARFGKIEAHQAVTAYGREALLRAKEAAEDGGCDVLHMYVDGMWVKKPGACREADFEPLVEEITRRTGLPIALDGIYRWVVFLASRVDARVPVPNRYFGVFQDGSLKMRGIEARRHDSAPFIANTQLAMLEALAQAPTAADLPAYLPQALRLLSQALDDLRLGRIPLADCRVTQKLSRAQEEYRTPSPAARAAAQLAAVGKHLRPGQRVRFLYLAGEPGVWAWDLPTPPNPAALDRGRYRTLLLRAAETVLRPILDYIGHPPLQPALFVPAASLRLNPPRAATRRPPAPSPAHAPGTPTAGRIPPRHP